jgi:hypothetical protein
MESDQRDTSLHSRVVSGQMTIVGSKFPPVGTTTYGDLFFMALIRSLLPEPSATSGTSFIVTTIRWGNLKLSLAGEMTLAAVVLQLCQWCLPPRQQQPQPHAPAHNRFAGRNNAA